MTEPWNVMLIPDAGPLLTLAHADQLDLLFKPGWTVVVVDTVLHEIIRSRSPVSEKLARWVSQSNVPLYQTKVFAKAQSSGIGIGEYQLPKLSDLGLQEAMAELALDSAGMMGLFLLDDHRMVSPPFLVPGNAKKVSTQAYLVYLQQRQYIESAIAVQKAAAIGRRTGTITHPDLIPSDFPFVEVPIIRKGQLGAVIPTPADSVATTNQAKKCEVPQQVRSNKTKDNQSADPATLKLGSSVSHPHLIEKALRSTAVAQAERAATSSRFSHNKDVVINKKMDNSHDSTTENNRSANETQRLNLALQKDPNSVNALVSALSGKVPLVEKPYLNSRKRNSKMIKAKAKAEKNAKQKPKIIQVEKDSNEFKTVNESVANRRKTKKSINLDAANIKDVVIKDAAVKEAVRAAAAKAAQAVDEALKEQANSKSKTTAKTQHRNLILDGDKKGVEKNKATRNSRPMPAPMPIAIPSSSLLPKFEVESNAISQENQPNSRELSNEPPDPNLVNAFAGLISKKT